MAVKALYRVPADQRQDAVDAAIEAWHLQYGSRATTDVVVNHCRRADMRRALRGVPFATAAPMVRSGGNINPVLLVGTADQGIVYVPLAWLVGFELPQLAGFAVYRTAKRAYSCRTTEPSQVEARAATCVGDIEPGHRYVEYLGEATAYGAGSRYCIACGPLLWAADRWADR